MAESEKFANLDANVGNEETISDHNVSIKQQNSVDDTIEEVDVVYVDGEDGVPETAEVVVDGDYVEVVEEEPLPPLLQPPHSEAIFNSLECVNFVVEPQQDYITPETERLQCSDGLDRSISPGYPVAIATLPFLPKQIPNPKLEWTINERKKFLAYRIVESLSREKRSDFIELMDLLGSSVLLGHIRRPMKRKAPLNDEMSIAGSSIDRDTAISLGHYDDDSYDAPALTSRKEADDEFDEGIDEDMVQLPKYDFIGASVEEKKNEESSKRFCPSCRLVLKRGIFYHHGRLIRMYGRCDVFTPKRFPCGESECPERLATVEKLCEHMFQVHNAPTQVHMKIFDSEAKFKAFLTVLESSGNYRMSRGSKELRRGVTHYYRCNRVFSMPRSKTGDNHSSRVPYHAEDPFIKTSSKLCIRTEEACTAFYTKCYLSDGRIFVRYCSHHLHKEDRVRFPLAVRSRVHEMAKKKLPLEVIIMVLRKERHLFCIPGTALEQRILSITPQKVQSILGATKRSLENTAIEPAIKEPDSKQKRKTKEARGAEYRKSLMDCQRNSEGKGNAEINTEEHGQVDTLTELELATLEEYEQNQRMVLDEFQSIRRDEYKKRLLRERVRVTVYSLGRMMRNFRFVSLNSDVLSRSYKTLEEILGLWSDDVGKESVTGDEQQSGEVDPIEECEENASFETEVKEKDVKNVKVVHQDNEEKHTHSDSILSSNNKEQPLKREIFSEDTSKNNPSRPLVTRFGRIVKRRRFEDT